MWYALPNKKDKKWGSPAFQDQNFSLKIEGKMAFWGNIWFIDNEGKNVIQKFSAYTIDEKYTQQYVYTDILFSYKLQEQEQRQYNMY